MLRIKLTSIKLFVFFLFIQLISCSNKLTSDKILSSYNNIYFNDTNSSQNNISYLNVKYLDSSYYDVSIDICANKFDTISSHYLDTVTFKLQYEANKAFIDNFPIGLKLFSNVVKTNWILFNYNINSVFYPIKLLNNKTREIRVPDSISIFQKLSNADFLLIITNTGICQKSADSTNKSYSTIINLEFLLLNNENGEVIAKDHITTESTFENKPQKWQYRSVFVKTAVDIIDKLPMFKK